MLECNCLPLCNDVSYSVSSFVSLLVDPTNFSISNM